MYPSNKTKSKDYNYTVPFNGMVRGSIPIKGGANWLSVFFTIGK